MERYMREWWHKEGFIQIYSPKLMSTGSEGGAELFEVKYFEQKAYLAQSPQFYKQMAMAAGFEKIFEIAPVFRANPSHTTRHDTEFTSLDVEMSYITSEEDVMQMEEKWLTHVMSRIKEEYGETISRLYGVEVVVPTLPFPRMTMSQVQAAIRERGYTGLETDLDTAGEKLLSQYVLEKYDHQFVFITQYPHAVRAFYHMRSGKFSKGYDLLWKGVEITTGAQREHRPEILKAQAVERGVKLEEIEDYLQFFAHGCPPHGGFGLSPSRLLMLLLELGNVREATFVPRDQGRLRP